MDDSVLHDFTQPDQLSDLTLIVEGTNLFVHKSYLAEWSGVWRRMFLEDYGNPEEAKEIFLADKKLNEITELLHCIYATQKPISEENVSYLLELSEEYEIERIKKRCEEFLLNQERSIQSLYLAQKHGLKNLFKVCFEFAKTRTVEELESSPEYKLLDKDVVIKIYSEKVNIMRNYANDLRQSESRLEITCDKLKVEKENMKRSLQLVQDIWTTPNKRCYKHITQETFDFSCSDCNDKVRWEIRRLCVEGQHVRVYFPSQSKHKK
ncbi:BTB and MATH domain-containing protein 38-like [Mytilus trossulus]|uniref:BTB and MATH domain-containing protein 38-like n=1 Tax=Mytilus trossulus TaxID=6551 RepID=UPI0030050A15